jgi:phosphoribosylformylglycinamidine cyclo-ligase
VTGDAYLKFDRLMLFNKGVGFELDNFKPQPIFSLIQQAAKQQRSPISDEEMFKTFNMGWGFAVVVDEDLAEKAVDLLERSDVEAGQIGTVTNSRKIVVKHRGKKIQLSRQ